jgi:6,7-dimethyl-8-ribityllumazine synthase
MTRAGSSGAQMPDIDGAGLRIGIISARFNDHIVVPLRDGARRALSRTGVANGDITEAWVPGAFELPLAAKALAETGKVDAVICLGTVIRGDTPHFDYVCNEAARGIQQAQLDTGVPVMFGVLTVDTEQQALDRVEGKVMTNKGEEAAEGAVEMALLLKCLRA